VNTNPQWVVTPREEGEEEEESTVHVSDKSTVHHQEYRNNVYTK